MDAANSFTIRQRLFLNAYPKSLCDLSKAARKAGVPRRTVYNWIESNPLFKEAVENVREEQIDFVEEQLLELIKAGKFRAIKFYLESKGASRGYGKLPRLKNNGKTCHPVPSRP